MKEFAIRTIETIKTTTAPYPCEVYRRTCSPEVPDD